MATTHDNVIKEDVQIQAAEHLEDNAGNLEYRNDEEEPEIHLSTWIAITAMCVSAFA